MRVFSDNKFLCERILGWLCDSRSRKNANARAPRRATELLKNKWYIVPRTPYVPLCVRSLIESANNQMSDGRSTQISNVRANLN